MHFEYKTISFDPLTSDGRWKGTASLDEKLNNAASEGWLVHTQWVSHDQGTWYFLMIRDKDPLARRIHA